MPAYYPVTICRSDGQFEVSLKNGAAKELNRPTAEQLDKTPDAEGYVDFYEPLGLEDTKAKDWRRKIGGMLMHVLGGKEHASMSFCFRPFLQAASYCYFKCVFAFGLFLLAMRPSIFLFLLWPKLT